MGTFDALRGRGEEAESMPGTAGLASDPADEVTDAELRDRAADYVLPGFLDREEATVALRDYFELADDDPRPGQVIDQLWAARLAEQETWTERSDYQRLESAFDRLGSEGVLTRTNFTCCQNCGTTEIDDERTPAPAADYPWREWAYAFFHQQDAERLAEGPTVLMLSFSAFRPAADLDPELLAAAAAGDDGARRKVASETDRRVGELVVGAFRDAGLKVDWNGDPRTRIAVRIEDWRKPLEV